MFKFLRNLLFPLNTAYYSRCTFKFTYMNGEEIIYKPQLYSIYGSSTPSENWRMFDEGDIICGHYPLAAMKKVGAFDWEHVPIYWRGSTFKVLDFPKWESEYRLNTPYIGKKYFTNKTYLL